jgi:hypothetical protein
MQLRMKLETAFAIAILATSACTSNTTPPTTDTTESTPHHHTLSHTSYILAWDWGNAKQDDTGGWRVINDLDYVIHITDGALVNAAVQLVPCPDAVGWFAPSAAHAGHGGGKPDETRWGGPLRESLTKPTALDLGSVEVGEHRYCQAHYLLAQAEATGPTMALTGTYLAPNSKMPVAFAIHTSTAWGGATDLPKDIVVNGNTGEAPHCLTLTRNLGTLLDGVDFEAMTSDQQARAVLRSLTSNIRITQHQH